MTRSDEPSPAGRAVPALVFLASFFLFVRLAFPSIAPFRDAGDIATAGAALGVAHAPGYPLHVLAAHAFSASVPLATSAYRLNVFSSAAAALAVLFVFLIATHVAGLPGGLAAAALALFWRPLLMQAGLSEIYALNAAATFGLVWAGLTLPRRSAHPARVWLAVAFAAGLSLGNHHTVLAALPALALLWSRDYRAGRLAGGAFTPWLALLAGLSLYAFIVVRARAGAAYVWGEPDSLAGLWRIMTRADYGVATLSTRQSTATPWDALPFWFQVWAGGWGAFGTVLSTAGFLWCFGTANRREWGGPLLLLWVFSGPAFALAARLQAGPLSEAILQPAMVVPGLVTAVAFGALAGHAARRGARWSVPVFGLLLVHVAMRGAPGLLGADQRRNFLAADYGRNLLRTAPPDAVLLMISDPAIFSVEHLRQTAGERRDARVIVDAPLAWRWARYRRLYPDLFAEGQPDGGRGLAGFQANRVPLYTDGAQAGLIDAVCPEGLAARVEWPKRSAACVEAIERSPSWEFYVRRPPSALTLVGDFYSRSLLETVSSGAYNGGLLLGQAGRAEQARRFYARALFWNPTRMLRWSSVF